MMRHGIALAVAAIAVLLGARPVPQAKLPPALAAIEPGQWQLREIGDAEPRRSLCVADPDRLVRLHHPDARCSETVVASDPQSVTIRYGCPGAGFGQTTISIETRTLIRVQTQGIANGMPFQSDYEGRRAGACDTARR